MIVEQTEIQSMTSARAWQLRAISSVWVVALTVAAFWMLLVWGIHRNSPRTLVSFHGLLHAAIGGQFFSSATSSIPPENPFYAGEPVAYYWFFQYLAAQLTKLFGLNIFKSLEALILIATGVLMTSALFLGRKLYRSNQTGLLMGYLIVAGTNPMGWVFAICLKIILGLNILRDDPNHLWGVVHPIYSWIRFYDFGGLYGPLLNFFLNITSRPTALAGLFVTVVLLHRSFTNPSSFVYIALGCASAITTALSPIIGITAGGTLVASLVASWFRDRRVSQASRDDVKLRMRSTLFAGIAMVAGILLAAPTFYHLMIGPSANHVEFWLFSLRGLRHAITVGSSIFLLAILAFVGLIRSTKDHRRFLGILIASALILLGLDAAFTLPYGNGANLFHAAVVLLAVPAAGSIVCAKSPGNKRVINKRLALGVVLVFLPTVLVLLAAYVNRPPVPVSFENESLARVPSDSDLGLLYQWARTSTDHSAVFIVDPRERVAVCGNTLEFPAMTNRILFTEASHHYIAKPYPDSKTRFDLAVRFSSGEKPEDADSVYLSKFNRPIYIVSYQAEDKVLMDRLKELYGTPAFHKGTVAVYQWPSKSMS